MLFQGIYLIVIAHISQHSPLEHSRLLKFDYNESKWMCVQWAKQKSMYDGIIHKWHIHLIWMYYGMRIHVMPSEYPTSTPNWMPLQLIVCVYSFGTHAKQQEMYSAEERLLNRQLNIRSSFISCRMYSTPKDNKIKGIQEVRSESHTWKIYSCQRSD